MASWTGKAATRPEIGSYGLRADIEHLVSLNFDGRIHWVDGDAQLADGLSVHLVAGHTAGSQAVRVWTEQGWVVLAGDAAHYFEEVEQQRPFSVFVDLEGMYNSFDRLIELTEGHGVVIPGHDPRLFDRYPAVPGHEGRVFRVA